MKKLCLKADNRVAEISLERKTLEWLVELELGQDAIEKIANYGCGNQHETLALMYIFGANEGIGFDKNPSVIHDATTLFENDRTNILNTIEEIRRKVQRYPELVVDDDKKWVQTLPDFFKELGKVNLVYMVQDITVQNDKIEPNYYDLAFCQRVLYQIMCSNGSTSALATILEMKRVIRPGGFVIANEKLSCKDNRKLEYGCLFQQAGLQEILVSTPDDYNMKKYCYQKPSC